MAWKTSGAEEIPKGSLLNMYRLNGVLKLQSLALSLSSSTCQNPELASRMEKYLAFGMHAGCYFFNCSHRVELTLDCSVEVTWVNTDAELSIRFDDSHHGVDPISWVLYASITPKRSIRSNSSLTFWSDGDRDFPRRVHDRVLLWVKLNVMSHSSDASQTSEGVSIFAQCVIRESFNAFH